jgi:hypothetical protein
MTRCSRVALLLLAAAFVANAIPLDRSEHGTLMSFYDEVGAFTTQRSSLRELFLTEPGAQVAFL